MSFTSRNEIEIKYLGDCQEHIPALAKLWYEEISRHWVKGSSIESRLQELSKHAQKGKMPLALVALYENRPIGMACLRETDGIQPDKKPWLGSLVVDPNHRGKKIGEKLIDEIKLLARSSNHENLYLLAFDPTIPNWYAKLGWEHIGYDELLGHRVTVMKCNL